MSEMRGRQRRCTAAGQARGPDASACTGLVSHRRTYRLPGANADLGGGSLRGAQEHWCGIALAWGVDAWPKATVPAALRALVRVVSRGTPNVSRGTSLFARSRGRRDHRPTPPPARLHLSSHRHAPLARKPINQRSAEAPGPPPAWTRAVMIPGRNADVVPRETTHEDAAGLTRVPQPLGEPPTASEFPPDRG